MSYRRYVANLSVLFVLAIAGGCSKSEPLPDRSKQKPEQVKLATGVPDTIAQSTGNWMIGYYNLNTASHGMTLATATTESDDASLHGVVYGKYDFALVPEDRAYAAAKGEGDWKGKAMDRLRTVAELQQESLNLVTTDDSGIRTLEDLKGKRVAYDRHGAAVLAAAGINVTTDLKGQELGAQAAAQALVKKEVDAAFITQAHPSPLLKDLVASGQKVRLVPITGMDKLLDARPYYREFRVPISNYAGIANDADTPTLAVRLVMVTAADVYEEAVYEMAKLLAKDLNNLRAGSPTLFYVNERDLGRNPVIPMHPGAQRGLKEAGALEGA